MQELIIGFLLLLSFSLLALQFADRVAFQWAAREAAREGARAAVAQNDEPSALEAGTASALQTLAAHRIQADTATIDVSIEPGGGQGDEGCIQPPFCRGATISASVTIILPELELLLFGTLPSTTWTAQHRERIDRYRSIPAGVAP